MSQTTAERKVLVVEDSVDLRQLYIRALRSESYQVLTAAHGIEALQQLTEGYRPQVILFDLHMPEMAGPEFLTELKKVCSWPVRTVVVSGEHSLAQIAQGLGTDGFIKKPVDLKNLCAEIQKQFAALVS